MLFARATKPDALVAPNRCRIVRKYDQRHLPRRPFEESLVQQAFDEPTPDSHPPTGRIDNDMPKPKVPGFIAHRVQLSVGHGAGISILKRDEGFSADFSPPRNLLRSQRGWRARRQPPQLVLRPDPADHGSGMAGMKRRQVKTVCVDLAIPGHGGISTMLRRGSATEEGAAQFGPSHGPPSSPPRLRNAALIGRMSHKTSHHQIEKNRRRLLRRYARERTRTSTS